MIVPECQLDLKVRNARQQHRCGNLEALQGGPELDRHTGPGDQQLRRFRQGPGTARQDGRAAGQALGGPFAGGLLGHAGFARSAGRRGPAPRRVTRASGPRTVARSSPARHEQLVAAAELAAPLAAPVARDGSDDAALVSMPLVKRSSAIACDLSADVHQTDVARSPATRKIFTQFVSRGGDT